MRNRACETGNISRRAARILRTPFFLPGDCLVYLTILRTQTEHHTATSGPRMTRTGSLRRFRCAGALHGRHPKRSQRPRPSPIDRRGFIVPPSHHPGNAAGGDVPWTLARSGGRGCAIQEYDRSRAQPRSAAVSGDGAGRASDRPALERPARKPARGGEDPCAGLGMRRRAGDSTLRSANTTNPRTAKRIRPRRGRGGWPQVEFGCQSERNPWMKACVSPTPRARMRAEEKEREQCTARAENSEDP